MSNSGLPIRKNPFTQFIGSAVLKLMGWKVVGPFPDLPKAVVIAAPHTSNWDFIVGIAAKFALQLHIHWLGKHTLFRKPFGPYFRWLGGTPIERSTSKGVVDQVVEAFKNQQQFLLGLSPEGTRKKVDRWKSGFYHMAKGAEVPIVPIAFDYSRKEIVIGEPLFPSDSMENDFRKMEDFYSDKEGKIPQNFNYEIKAS